MSTPQALVLSDLKPFVSVTLARAEASTATSALASLVLEGVHDLLDLGSEDSQTELVARLDPEVSGELVVGALHYVEHHQPAWTIADGVEDIINHLALVAVRKKHVAVLLTDARRARQVLRFVEGDGTAGIPLAAIDPGTLNAAFITGEARTLWLSGIHRRSTTKADSKVLSGLDLRDALDPYDDQSYFFTAARAVVDMGGARSPMGVSPRKSKVWAGVSRTWLDFERVLTGTLTLLERTETEKRSDRAPLPILAVPADSVAGLKGAFDLTIMPPELDGDGLDPAAREQLEELSYHTDFEVSPTSGPGFKVAVRRRDVLLGSITFAVEISGPERVRVSGDMKAASGREAELEEVLDACARRDWLTVRYESGHTLAGGVVYSPRLREFPFRGWSWVDFRTWEIRREKPTGASGAFDSELIGEQDQKSLFDWVCHKWPLENAGTGRGWLLCDDHSAEAADFIHFSDESTPTLSLIHVKGAHGKEATMQPGKSRNISVGDYEVVAAQAIKNLRRLDRQLLAEGLAESAGRILAKATWHNGQRQPDREGFKTALKAAGENYLRRVIIVQPRVWERDVEAARSQGQGAKFRRLLQLEALLYGVESNCHDLGAEFAVVADGSPAKEGA